MGAWVLVSDASRARVFAVDAESGELETVTDLVHPQSRLHGRDMEADAPGLKYSSNHAGRHTSGPEHDSRETARIEFAREVVHFLEEARKGGRFHRLHVVAAPRFLGRLRGNYPRPLADMVRSELDKELSGLRPAEIRTHLPERL